MSKKVTIEVDPQHEAIMRRALAFAEEMEQLAQTAPEGEVFDACEEAVIDKGRQLLRPASTCRRCWEWTSAPKRCAR